MDNILAIAMWAFQEFSSQNSTKDCHRGSREEEREMSQTDLLGPLLPQTLKKSCPDPDSSDGEFYPFLKKY